MLKLSFNTFAFQQLVFEGKNEPCLFKNALSLTLEFLYDNLKKLIFLFKMVIKNSCVKFMAFSKKNDFFPLKRGAEKQKC